ncbi:hypothetical protein V3C52_11750 [Escherichia coli]
MIRDDFDPARIAAIYKHYASAISVLTDEKYFQGALISSHRQPNRPAADFM